MVHRHGLRAYHAHDRSGSASAQRGAGDRRDRGVPRCTAWPRCVRAVGYLVGDDNAGLDLRGDRRVRRDLANRRDAMRSAAHRNRIRAASDAGPRWSPGLRRVDRDFAERCLFFAGRFDGDRVDGVHDDCDRDRGEYAPAAECPPCGRAGRRDRAVAHCRSHRLRDGVGDGCIADYRRRRRLGAIGSSATAPARMVGSAPRASHRLRGRRYLLVDPFDDCVFSPAARVIRRVLLPYRIRPAVDRRSLCNPQNRADFAFLRIHRRGSGDHRRIRDRLATHRQSLCGVVGAVGDRQRRDICVGERESR